MDNRIRRMTGHGAIIIFIGLIAGFGLIMSLLGGFEVFPGTIIGFDIPGDTAAWARTHVGGLLNGMLVILFALFIHAAQLPERLASRLFWMLVGTGYANTAFYWGGLFASNRALTLGDNRFGPTSIAAVLGFVPALLFAIVLMIAMAMVIRWAFSARESG